LSTQTIRSKNRAAQSGKTLLQRWDTLSKRMGTPSPMRCYSLPQRFS